MVIQGTELPEVLEITPTVLSDQRGFFYECFRADLFSDAVGYTLDFVQDNHSRSSRGILRGLHYQLPPYSQGKLVRVVHGSVFDVAVDIRRASLTCGRWVGRVLSAENKKQLWIPPGFAHGFLALSDSAEFLYKTTSYYTPQAERCILWNDPDLNISWPTADLDVKLSVRDAMGTTFKLAELDCQSVPRGTSHP